MAAMGTATRTTKGCAVPSDTCGTHPACGDPRSTTPSSTSSLHSRANQCSTSAPEWERASRRPRPLVWAVNTMHHWVDPKRGAVEIARVLAPNGRVVLVDEDFSDPSHPDHEQFASRNEDHDHGFHMVDLEAMAALFDAAGLTDIDAGKRDVAGRPVLAVLSRKLG